MNTGKHSFNEGSPKRALILVGMLACLVLLPDFTRTSHPQSEAGAIGSLKGIYKAALEYEQTYKNGFPRTLRALGPPRWDRKADCSAAGLVDGKLAMGQRYGYSFEYVPGHTMEGTLGNCIGSGSFAVVARPAIFEGRSFFIDETGTIRMTLENRPANARDTILDLRQ